MLITNTYFDSLVEKRVREDNAQNPKLQKYVILLIANRLDKSDSVPGSHFRRAKCAWETGAGNIKQAWG